MAQISPALDARPALQSAGRLVHEAVHRNRPLSREGLSERLFTLAFGGLVYPQIWEDPAVDHAALEITPDHHVVTIASGGCNVMSYLTAIPARITAVDLNRAHVALTRLKLAGVRHLPSWDAFYRFFGEADDVANIRTYRATISRRISTPRPATYWEGAGAVGRRRIALFAPISTATACSAASSAPATVWRGFMASTSPTSLKARDRPRSSAPSSTARLRRCSTSGWCAGSTRRRPRSSASASRRRSIDALAAGERRHALTVLRARLERLACGFPLRDNYFAWQAFGRALCPGRQRPAAALSPARELRCACRRARRAGRGASASLTEPCAASAPDSVDRYVLLDAQDWMSRRPARLPCGARSPAPRGPAPASSSAPPPCPRSCRAGSHRRCSIAGAMSERALARADGRGPLVDLWRLPSLPPRAPLRSSAAAH